MTHMVSNTPSITSKPNRETWVSFRVPTMLSRAPVRLGCTPNLGILEGAGAFSGAVRLEAWTRRLVLLVPKFKGFVRDGPRRRQRAIAQRSPMHQHLRPKTHRQNDAGIGCCISLRQVLRALARCPDSAIQGATLLKKVRQPLDQETCSQLRQNDSMP